MRILAVPEPRWFRGFERALASSGLSANTVRCYVPAVRRLLAWLDGNGQAFGVFGAKDLQRYQEELVREGLRPATVNFHLQAVRWLCRWASKRGTLKADPSDGVDTHRVKRSGPPVGLSAGAAHRFLRAAGQAATDLSLRDCALVQLLLRTGVRIDEAVSLRVQDVAAYERSGRVRLRGGGREVPLSAEARRAIRAYLDARGHPKGSEPLFVSREGHALSVRRAQAAVLEIGHRAKLERVTPQVLRHTFAVNYLKDNPGKLPQLATLLGHQSPDSVAIYAQSA